MKRKPVNYSYEHGDETLPHLKDLVSDIPDPMKEKILEYLRTHCILACSGMIKDSYIGKLQSEDETAYDFAADRPCGDS